MFPSTQPVKRVCLLISYGSICSLQVNEKMTSGDHAELSTVDSNSARTEMTSTCIRVVQKTKVAFSLTLTLSLCSK